ncbi:ABC transporter permease [Krasilnikovia sp. M28-CT-15]|uniref:ABC transporter permease n=1 Tax=Krasilnikovia sp. M28-CT-15 TaxID=3373540 RepID=UPI003876755C
MAELTGKDRPRSRFHLVDLVHEVIESVRSAPARTAGSAVGVVLASAAFVSTYGLAATLSNQVSDAFDAARATEITVSRTTDAAPAGPAEAGGLCDPLAIEDVRRLAGVTSAGPYNFVRDRAVTRPLVDEEPVAVPVIGIDSGSLAVLGPHLTAGRLPDDGHVRRADPVALISARTARKLALTEAGGVVEISGKKVTVIGIFDDLVREPEALDAALMPYRSVDGLLGGSTNAADVSCGAMISTVPGAASGLADQVAVALSPEDPHRLKVIAPPDPQSFRRGLESRVRLLTLALSAAAMLVGLISMAASAATSSANRAAEIGLRKAIGARSRHILVQLLGEQIVVGLLSSLIGAFVGMFVVVGVSLVNSWAPVLDLGAALVASLSGSFLGALAGLVPAVRAARLTPVRSLRR